MVGTSLVLSFIIFQFESQSSTLLFRLLEFLLQFLHLLEKLFKAILILIVLLNLDFNLFVSRLLGGIAGQVLNIDPLLPWRDSDRRPRLHLPSHVGIPLLHFRFLERLAFAFDDGLFLDDDWLLQGELVLGR
jgi:hypothetical protein